MHVSFLLKVFKVPPWLSGSHLHGMTGEALRDLASAGPLLVISSHGPLGEPMGLCTGSSPSWQSPPPTPTWLIGAGLLRFSPETTSLPHCHLYGPCLPDLSEDPPS